MDNQSGLYPLECKVLIKPEKVEEMTEGGIVLTTETTDRDQYAQVEGIVVAVGGMAYDDWTSKGPQPGENVVIAKYAGVNTRGNDGEMYRVINDGDLLLARAAA